MFNCILCLNEDLFYTLMAVVSVLLVKKSEIWTPFFNPLTARSGVRWIYVCFMKKEKKKLVVVAILVKFDDNDAALVMACFVQGAIDPLIQCICYQFF